MTSNKFTPQAKWLVFGIGAITAVFLLTLWAAVNQRLELDKDAISGFGLVSLWTLSDDPHTSIAWGDSPRNSFVCTAVEYRANGNCGLDIKLGDGQEEGVDLSNFNQLVLSLKFDGGKQNVRVGYRNPAMVGSKFYDVQYEVELAISKGLNTITLPFDRFTVPKWWMSKRNLTDHKQWGPGQRNNVTRLGFNLNSPIKEGIHEVNDISIRLQKSNSGIDRLVLISASIVIYLTLIGICLRVLLTKCRQSRPMHSEELSRAKPEALKEPFKMDFLADAELDQTMLYDIPSGLVRKDIILQSNTFTEKRNFIEQVCVAVVEFYDLEEVLGDSDGHSKLDELMIRLSLIIKGALEENECAIRWGDYQIALVTSNKKESALKKRVEVLLGDLAGNGKSVVDLLSHLRYSVKRVSTSESIVQAIDSALEN